MSESILATAAQVAAATSGKLVAGDPARVATWISTDSRSPAKDALFVALRGDNFDGSRFVADAVGSGASMVLVEHRAFQKGLGDLGQAAVVTVRDSLTALADLATWHRGRFDVRVVGITGSNGKTSTKEMTAAVLGGAPQVLFNRGNFNNQVGMPRTLLELRSGHHHAVLEMGMNAPGEIRALARIARPRIGLITNVHPVHLEGLGSIDAVARAKGELLDALPSDGLAVVNADDPYVLKQLERSSAPRSSFGRGPNADVRLVEARQIEGKLQVELTMGKQSIRFRLDRLGLHNAMNAAAAAAVGAAEGIATDLIARRLERAPLPAMRMERLELGSGQLLVDCYNANPRSVQVALQTLVSLEPGACTGGRHAVLGEMRELGSASEELHWQTGRTAAKEGLDSLCAFGAQAGAIARGAKDGGLPEILESESVEEATDWARQRLDAAGCVLLKGSRAMRMERIAIELARVFGVCWRREEED